jgi:hypothetical protein
VGKESFFSSQPSRPALGPPRSFLGVNWPGLGINKLPPPSTQFKNQYSSTTTIHHHPPPPPVPLLHITGTSSLDISWLSSDTAKANFNITHKIFFEDLIGLQMFQKLGLRKIVMFQCLEHKNDSVIPTYATKIFR